MKLLLHCCCGPCAIKPYRELKNEFDQVTGFYYNPNIHPFLEYQNRLNAIREYSSLNSFSLVEADYDYKNFFRRVVNKEDFGIRCEICYRIRLEKTANYAKDNGFDVFTTTLLISPYQNQEKIVSIGEELAKKEGLKFLSRDLRGMFKESQIEAKDQNLYRQKYCGCIYSEKERYSK